MVCPVFHVASANYFSVFYAYYLLLVCRMLHIVVLLHWVICKLRLLVFGWIRHLGLDECMKSVMNNEKLYCIYMNSDWHGIRDLRHYCLVSRKNLGSPSTKIHASAYQFLACMFHMQDRRSTSTSHPLPFSFTFLVTRVDGLWNCFRLLSATSKAWSYCYCITIVIPFI